MRDARIYSSNDLRIGEPKLSEMEWTFGATLNWALRFSFGGGIWKCLRTPHPVKETRQTDRLGQLPQSELMSFHPKKNWDGYVLWVHNGTKAHKKRGGDESIAERKQKKKNKKKKMKNNRKKHPPKGRDWEKQLRRGQGKRLSKWFPGAIRHPGGFIRGTTLQAEFWKKSFLNRMVDNRLPRKWLKGNHWAECTRKRRTDVGGEPTHSR